MAAIALSGAARAQSPSTSFVYQGRLESDGQPVTGLYDLRFTLFTAATGGTALTPPACIDDVSVSDGVFAAEIPLIIPISAVEAFLQVEARADTGLTCGTPSGFTTMLPRVRLAPSPRSVYAMAASPKSPTIPGAIRFSSANGSLEVSDGIAWYPVTLGAAISPAGTAEFTAAGTQSFVVPAGVTRLTVDIWGGGGGGGGKSPGLDSPTSGTCNSGTPGYSGGGGGGASGSAGRFAIDVTPGESLTVIVGAGGNLGSIGQVGGKGGTSFIRRGGADLITARGGVGGSPGVGGSMGIANQSCGGRAPSGPGGSPESAATAAAPAQTAAALAGNAGENGLLPACFGQTFPSVINTWCPAVGGSGGAPITLASPVPSRSGGTGGAGGSGSTAAQPGVPGRVRIFWY